MSLIGRPTLRGSMRESPLYQTMGLGLTEPVFLVGHSDALELNDPYRVTTIQEAINKFEAATDSPLLRGLLEAYYGGARDIYLVAAAPMGDYESTVADRNVVIVLDHRAHVELPMDRDHLVAFVVLQRNLVVATAAGR